ncbi:MAG: FAD-dependent oxidoreductase [Ruminococcaceae bacterium]|nr:FAD-dependent oxidoreductase [Oscillospiraceae bacterium]
MHDIIVIGAGPAGLTAAIYALRFGKSVLIIEKETFGGQITHSPKVENYPGFKEMSGTEFADKLIDQTISLGGEIELEKVVSVTPGDNIKVKCKSGKEFESKAVIIAAGSKHRQLGLEGENELVGNGVSYCAVCDGAFCKGQKVAVVGGGNTALQEAVMLSDICESVTIIQNLSTLTGEKRLADILEKKDNVKIILNHTVCELVGKDKLESLIIKNTVTDKKTEIVADTVFVAIGQAPENKPFENICELDKYGYIVSDESLKLKTPGIFVAGDCRTKAVRQITTATGDGAIAAVNACRYIDSL